MKSDSDHLPASSGAAEPDKDSPMAAIVAALEEDIIFGRLHPRERLIEDELMQRFGIKRYVVREVLLTLDRMALIERRKNVGALVRSFTPREVAELYGVRALLETEAARLIPLPVPEASLAKLVAIQQQHDDAVMAGSAPRVFRANLAFHQALFELAGNETLQRAIGEYARQTHPIRFSALVSGDYRERARREHWQIIEALRAGDRETLVALCGQHLLPSRDAYLAAHEHHFKAA
jgi:DNA-binding GntR family transcriptional regulator